MGMYPHTLPEYRARGSSLNRRALPRLGFSERVVEERATVTKALDTYPANTSTLCAYQLGHAGRVVEIQVRSLVQIDCGYFQVNRTRALVYFFA
jgi:hypothetical protein